MCFFRRPPYRCSPSLGQPTQGDDEKTTTDDDIVHIQISYLDSKQKRLCLIPLQVSRTMNVADVKQLLCSAHHGGVSTLQVFYDLLIWLLFFGRKSKQSLKLVVCVHGTTSRRQCQPEYFRPGRSIDHARDRRCFASYSTSSSTGTIRRCCIVEEEADHHRSSLANTRRHHHQRLFIIIITSTTAGKSNESVRKVVLFYLLHRLWPPEQREASNNLCQMSPRLGGVSQ